MESGFKSSYYPNCHHQTVPRRFSLKTHNPPPYERKIWHYDEKTGYIQRSIKGFLREIAFANADVNRKVHILNKTCRAS